MSHCYLSFGCSSCHQRRVIGTQTHPSLQAASARAGVKRRATLHPAETMKAGLWRMGQSWRLAAATGRVGSVARDTSPPRSRKGYRKACLKGQINRASGMAQTLRLGWWRAGTWWFPREKVTPPARSDRPSARWAEPPSPSRTTGSHRRPSARHRRWTQELLPGLQVMNPAYPKAHFCRHPVQYRSSPGIVERDIPRPFNHPSLLRQICANRLLTSSRLQMRN